VASCEAMAPSFLFLERGEANIDLTTKIFTMRRSNSGRAIDGEGCSGERVGSAV
jgi:hypothetical protein